MKWASSIESTEGTPSGPSMELNWAQCVEKLIQSLKDGLEGNPDLLILFVSPDHKNNFEK